MSSCILANIYLFKVNIRKPSKLKIEIPELRG